MKTAKEVLLKTVDTIRGFILQTETMKGPGLNDIVFGEDGDISIYTPTPSLEELRAVCAEVEAFLDSDGAK